MIVSYLMGGLGNQLFQWAYGKSLSQIYNLPHYIDKSFYLNQNGVTPREYNLNKFDFLNVEYKEKKELDDFIEVQDCGYPNLQIDVSKNYFLYGYFQSEYYFLNCSDIIRQALKIPDEFRKKSIQKYENLSNSISIHIRRTDYITSGGFHPVQPISYYINALKLLNDYENLLIFSDDIEWCKSNIQLPKTIFVENNSNVDDLWLMSLCRDNIIANSSFSWWGAWLNENKNKRVLAPKNWFNGQNTPILIPKTWITI
jgi:hypothetical protein